MPSSPPFHLTKMVTSILKTAPKSVLDIGVGFGKWGFLCREYLDINEQRYRKEDWQIRIDGYEAFAAYATPTYDYIYNHIYYGDVLYKIDELPNYDLIILGDVIEHFTKEEGLLLLQKLKAKASFILISSPTKFFQQELFENPHEQHKCLWTIEDFKDFVFDYDEFEDFLFVTLLDCKNSGLVSNKDRQVSFMAYSIEALRRHPQIVSLTKSLLRKLR